MVNTKCMYCGYWSLWGNECVHPKSKRLFKYTPALTKACELFEPDMVDEEEDGEGKQE
jgi:hypothetical protein